MTSMLLNQNNTLLDLTCHVTCRGCKVTFRKERWVSRWCFSVYSSADISSIFCVSPLRINIMAVLACDITRFVFILFALLYSHIRIHSWWWFCDSFFTKSWWPEGAKIREKQFGKNCHRTTIIQVYGIKQRGCFVNLSWEARE